MALTQDRLTKTRSGGSRSFVVATGATIYAGGLVCINSSGYAVPATTATGLKCVGVSAEQILSAAAGTRVLVHDDIACLKNSATDPVALADITADSYIVDDETVAKTNGTSTRSVAGKIYDVNSDGVWVKFI